VLLGRRAKLTVRRERPLCKREHGANGKAGCRWGWVAVGKKRRRMIALRRNFSFRLRIDNRQSASIRVRTRSFSSHGKRYAAATSAVRLSGPKR